MSLKYILFNSGLDLQRIIILLLLLILSVFFQNFLLFQEKFQIKMARKLNFDFLKGLVMVPDYLSAQGHYLECPSEWWMRKTVDICSLYPPGFHLRLPCGQDYISSGHENWSLREKKKLQKVGIKYLKSWKNFS